MTLGVRVIVCNDKNEVLLVRHTYVHGWHLPGGGVERGQTMRQAAKRELREEAEIELTGKLQLVSFLANQRASKRDHVAVLSTRDWRFIKTFEANAEISEIGFFSLQNLPDGTTEPTQNRLKEFFDSQPGGDYW